MTYFDISTDGDKEELGGHIHTLGTENYKDPTKPIISLNVISQSDTSFQFCWRFKPLFTCLLYFVDVCHLNRTKYCGEHGHCDSNVDDESPCKCIEPYEGNHCETRGGMYMCLV